VNDGDDCPPFWEHTATYAVEYTPGQSVKIAGIPRNPGEVFSALRGDLTIATPLEYPIEYFRAEIETPTDYDPVSSGITSITLSDFPAGWGPSTSPITLTKVSGDVYERTVSGTVFQRIRKVGGVWVWYDRDSGAGLGPYDHGRIRFRNSSIEFFYDAGEVILRYPNMHIFSTASNSPTDTWGGFTYVSSSGGYDKYQYGTTGTSEWWTDGSSVWSGWNQPPTSTTPSTVYNTVRWDSGDGISSQQLTSTHFENKASVSIPQLESFWGGGAEFQCAATYAGGIAPPEPLPDDLISWAVLTYPNPRQLLIPATNYGDLPIEAAPGEATLGWDKFSFADQLVVNNYPATAVSGNISLTIRSACENPPP